MASRRHAKKHLNNTVFALLDEAYSVQLDQPKLKDKSNQLIDQIVSFHDQHVSLLATAKSKKDLAGFKDRVEEQGYDFYQEIMNLHA